MKLYQLFEIDPELGRTLGRAARGIGAAGRTISEPPPMKDIQGRIEQGIDELEKQIQKNPQQPFAQTFRNFLEKEKDKVKVTGKIGMNYQNDRLIRGGKPNSRYIRAVLKKFYEELNDYIEKSSDKATRDYYAKQKLPSFRPEI